MWNSPRCYHFTCHFSVRFLKGGSYLKKKNHWLATCILKVHKGKQTNLSLLKINTVESLLSISYPSEREIWKNTWVGFLCFVLFCILVSAMTEKK